MLSRQSVFKKTHSPLKRDTAFEKIFFNFPLIGIIKSNTLLVNAYPFTCIFFISKKKKLINFKKLTIFMKLKKWLDYYNCVKYYEIFVIQIWRFVNQFIGFVKINFH